MKKYNISNKKYVFHQHEKFQIYKIQNLKVQMSLVKILLKKVY